VAPGRPGVRVITSIACSTVAPLCTRGLRSPVRISSPTFIRRRPRSPPGWKRAKSSGPKRRPSCTTSASASPSASIAVVDALGARPVRTGFVDAAELEHQVGVLAERRVGVLGDRDHRHTDRLHVRQHHQQFLGLARLRERQQHVARIDAAEVAVDGLGRVQEDRRRAGRRERRRDLLGDETRPCPCRR
jgi:hypothetical protein